MSKSELVAQNATPGELTQQDINNLAKAAIIPSGTPIEQVLIFAKVCREHGLSPFSKEIYLVKYGGNFVAQVGIDGFRRRACETGEHAGTDDPRFNVKSDGTFQTAFEIKAANKLPETCSVTVYRMIAGQRVPFSHTAIFSEFSSGQNKWKTMPFQMIAKVAEAFALKKGFSDKLRGLHIPEEETAFADNQQLPGSITADKEMFIDEIKTQIAQYKTVTDLLKFYRQNPQWQGDEEITQLFTDRKNEIENG